MTGLLHTKKGEILFKGKEVRHRLPSTLSDMYIIPEEFDLPNMSLQAYIQYNAPFYPHFNESQLINNLALFEIDFSKKLFLQNLSMGQKKKIQMCFALATNTSLLVMDEPSNGLDIPSKSQFRQLIANNMNDDKTIIIATHQVRDLENLFDHIIIIDQSQILLNASNSEISRRLFFTELSMTENTDKIIYKQPSTMGYSAIIPNEYQEGSRLNLELLFNAVLTKRDHFTLLFNHKNNNHESNI